MDLNSPLFDRVRIRPDEEALRARLAPRCQHPGCQEAGEFRAPLGRKREGQYVLMCLPHVQAYNKSYNYFEGMSDEAIQNFQKDALTGHRPTWTIGVGAKGAGPAAPENAAAGNPFSAFSRAQRRKEAAEERAKARYGRLALKALSTLHLDESATPEIIRAKYKSWVKRLHPDANGGDRSREDKLREIINAYNTLKAAGHA
jgi:curved DNA-binding protein CbpA